jgi:hypothetical protein
MREFRCDQLEAGYRQQAPGVVHFAPVATQGKYLTMRQTQINLDLGSARSKPAWAEVWHLWRVIIPRRSITGELLFGRVWRRHDGRHWIYKRFLEFDHREQP